MPVIIPQTLRTLLESTRELLGKSEALVKRGTITTEAEQIVLSACRSVGVTNLGRVDLFLRADEQISAQVSERALAIAKARAAGRPLQHLIGVQVFMGHEYVVNPDVLIPRPETEILVTCAVDRLSARSGGGQMFGAEIGLGSGVISIELLEIFPQLRMSASEVSEAAIQVAKQNCHNILGECFGDRITVIKVDDRKMVLEPFKGRFDFLISNPPYLIRSDQIDMDVLNHEPELALFAADNDPLFFYRKFATDGAKLLSKKGQIFVELSSDRAGVIVDLFTSYGWQTQIVPDLAGRVRVLIAELE